MTKAFIFVSKICVYLFYFKAKIQNAVTSRNQIDSFGTSSSSDFYESSFYLCRFCSRGLHRPSVYSSFKFTSLWRPLEHLKIPVPFHESLLKETEGLLEWDFYGKFPVYAYISLCREFLVCCSHSFQTQII